MNRITRIALALLLTVAAVLTMAGCGSSKKTQLPPISMEMTPQQAGYTFSAQPSARLQLSREGAQAVLEAVEAQQADYAYEALYDLEEAFARLDFDASVQVHRYSALNDAGQLEAEHLAALVAQNNVAFLEPEPFGYEAVEQENVLAVCRVIVTTVNEMRQRYPDIDWQRVYCNLGSLKILYNVGMLSYAQVSKEQVLSISKNNASIVQIMEGENGFRNVLIHETMHIIQLGCSCEQIENCERRAGISVFWEDYPLNNTDWTWLVEGSAERNMCSLTGDGAVSYQYKMDYICSFTMSLLLRQQVRPDTVQTLCFYEDPQLLFDAFGCQSRQEQEEILKMMFTMEVLQSQPSAFFEAYTQAYGTDPRQTDESLNDFCYGLKPAVCTTLAKEFYQNLVPFLTENDLPVNDLFFLLNLFEGHLNQHLTYDAESKQQINAPFMESYRAMRRALFDALEAENPDLDMDALYAAYEIKAGEGQLNAELSMLPEEKRDFMAERAAWQAELMGLGVKVQ